MRYVLAIAFRDFRIRLSNPVLPLWDVLVPVVYLLVFGSSLERWIGNGASGLDYPRFFLGGVLSMVSFGIVFNSSYAFFEDLQGGIFHEMLYLSLRAMGDVAGQTAFQCSIQRRRSCGLHAGGIFDSQDFSYASRVASYRAVVGAGDGRMVFSVYLAGAQPARLQCVPHYNIGALPGPDVRQQSVLSHRAIAGECSLAGVGESGHLADRPAALLHLPFCRPAPPANGNGRVRRIRRRDFLAGEPQTEWHNRVETYRRNTEEAD